MNSDEMNLARFFMKNSRCYVNYGLGIRTSVLIQHDVLQMLVAV